MPPNWRVVEASACVNGWNSFASCSGVMPMPLSRTLSVIHSAPPPWGANSRATSSQMVPSRVNLQALLSRLNRLCRTLVRSASIVPTSAAQVTHRVLAFWATSGWMTACTSPSRAPTSTVS